jgi:hypothetical protein
MILCHGIMRRMLALLFDFRLHTSRIYMLLGLNLFDNDMSEKLAALLDFILCYRNKKFSYKKLVTNGIILFYHIFFFLRN